VTWKINFFCQIQLNGGTDFPFVFSYALHKEVGTMQSAKDLTFVSVRDRNGRPLKDATSVEVWNTQGPMSQNFLWP
jgi:hypothetical protein